jgi:hypothetical protein
MGKIGKEIVTGLRQINRDIRSGKPARQIIVKRTVGKNEVTFTRKVVVAPLRRRRKCLTWAHAEFVHFLYFTGLTDPVGTVYRVDGGWHWKSDDGRNTELAGEKPVRLNRALIACKAFAKGLHASGALK